MKNKRLTIILSILCVLVLIVVLNSTVFALKKAEVVFMDNSTTYNSNQILETAEFPMGQNIFSINKEIYVDKIQNKYPYLRVVNIETVFPNKLIINAVERKELFAFELNGGGYAIADDQLFVVKKETETYVNTGANPILVNGIVKPTTELAKPIQIDNENVMLLKTLAYVMQEWTGNFSTLKDKIKCVTLNYDRDNQMKIKMRSGVNILILDSNKFLSNKFQLAISTYNTERDVDGNPVDYKSSGIIEIRTNNAGQIYGIYTAN